MKVPPPVVPELGLTPVRVGAAAWALKLPAGVARPSTLVTTTTTGPSTGATDGVVQVSDPGGVTTTLVAGTPPMVTAAPAAKFVPEIVMAVPPPLVAASGFTSVIPGTGP